MKDLRDTRVLITGAAVRIGRGIALAMARAGAAVAVHYHRSEAEAAALLAELESISSGHCVTGADLRISQQRDALIPGLLERGFGLNCLVNNASFYRRSPLLAITAEQWDEDYGLNFLAPFRLMCDFARLCKHGCIINILDQRVTGIDPSAGAYGFAKKSLRNATEAAAVQWAPDIRVNGVAPGFVFPPPGVAVEKMAKFLAGIPAGKASTPEEVAEACVFLAGSETITGQILFVDGGLHLVRQAVAEKDG